ncbi:MAG: hypothetical protein M1389_12300 [Chloroflexi bacterium]|nr:hypothetical protein [Chloroflexota bacterium]
MARWRGRTSRIALAHIHSGLAIWFAVFFVAAILAAGLLGGCGSVTTQEPSKEVKAMLQDRLEAMSAADTQAIAKFYAVNAVLDNYIDNNKHLQGQTAIADYITSVVKDFHMQWKAAGDPIQYDKYVVQPVSTWELNGPGMGAELHIFEIDSSGQIARSWIVGWVQL